MAKYRQLRTEFWRDGFIVDLTPEEKYFYLYLMTNDKTSQCGIYELPIQIMCNETGYDRKTIMELLDRFTSYKKIIYSQDTKEIMILNWFKYNEPNNLNAVKCVNKELNGIKNKFMIKALYDQCVELGVDAVKIFHNVHIEKTETKDFIYEEFRGDIIPLQGAYKTLLSKEVINNKQEVINNKQEVINKKEEVRSKEEVLVKGIDEEHDFSSSAKDNNSAILGAAAISADYGICDDFSKVLDTFNNNIHPVSPIERKALKDWSNKVTCEVIILAIEEAVNYNAKTMKYINIVLKNWTSKGIKTSEEVMEEKRNWNQKKQIITLKREKKSSFCDFQQRQYDCNLLEKQLLGL